MLSAHPKLQILPQHARTSSRSTAVHLPLHHTRLRSLHLPSLVRAEKSDSVLSVPRSASPPADATDQSAVSTTTRQPTRQEILITRALLKSQETPPLVTAELAEHVEPLGAASEFGLAFRPPLDSSPDSDKRESPMREFDSLIAQVLPKLVPTIKVGTNIGIVPLEFPSGSRRPSTPLEGISRMREATPEMGNGHESVQASLCFTSWKNRSLPTFPDSPPTLPPLWASVDQYSFREAGFADLGR